MPCLTVGCDLTGSGAAPNDAAPPPPPPSASFDAIITPAMNTLVEGQAINDLADYAAMVDPSNFSSTGGVIVSAVVEFTGAATAADAPLAEGDSAGFFVTVTDDRSNQHIFDAGSTVVEYDVQVIQTVGNEAQLLVNPAAPDSLVVELIIAGSLSYDGTYFCTAGEIRNGPHPFASTVSLSYAGLSEGSVITCDDGLWSSPSGMLTLSRTWHRDGVAIPGETGATYTIAAEDLGSTISCEVTGDDGTNGPMSVFSAPVDVPGSAAFDPVSLFANGEAGAFYVFSDTTNLREDEATSNVPAVGTAIGFAEDLSGNANHAVQTSQVNKPLLQSDAVGPYLEFDGSNDALTLPQLGISGAGARSLFVVADMPTGTMNVNSNATGRRWTFVDETPPGNMRIEVAGGAFVSTFTTGDLAVYGITFEGSTLADHVLHKNGATEPASGTVTINSTDNDNQIGRRQTSIYRPPSLRAFLIIDRVLTAAETSDLKSHFYSEYGIVS